MKNFFKSIFGMFMGGDGILSWSKLQSVLSFIVAAVISIMGLLSNGSDHIVNSSNIVSLVGAFLVASSGLSAYGKLINNKYSKEEKQDE